jgi:DNA-binding response OmpR family regulator
MGDARCVAYPANSREKPKVPFAPSVPCAHDARSISEYLDRKNPQIQFVGRRAMTELERLRYRVEELEQILGVGPDDVALIKRALPVRKSEAGVLSMLAKRNVTLSKDAIVTAMFGGRPECDQPDARIVDVYISRLRTALRESGTGIEISTDWGRGYYMTVASKRALTALIASVQEIAA